MAKKVDSDVSDVLLRQQRRKQIMADAMKRMLVGRREKIVHPIILLKELYGYGDYIAENDITPSLASLAMYLNVSKNLIYDMGRDAKKYFYYELQSYDDAVIDIREISYEKELEFVRKGVGVSLLSFFDINYLIDYYEMRHSIKLSEADRKRIQFNQNAFIKQFSKQLASKHKHKNIVDKMHKIITSKKIRLYGKSFRKYWKNHLENYDPNESCFRDTIRMILCGNVIVKSISFQEVIQTYQQISEIEWIEIGRTARNPAMSIFMLLNSAGFRPIYENKQITQQVVQQSQLEAQHYEQKMHELLESNISKSE